MDLYFQSEEVYSNALVLKLPCIYLFLMSMIRSLKRNVCLQCKHKSNEKDGPKLKDAERKSLVPRLVYLSMHGCTTFLREGESNGASSNVTSAGEMKTLLEKYARSIGYSFDDALSIVLGMSSGKKAVKVTSVYFYPFVFTYYLHTRI